MFRGLDVRQKRAGVPAHEKDWGFSPARIFMHKNNISFYTNCINFCENLLVLVYMTGYIAIIIFVTYYFTKRSS